MPLVLFFSHGGWPTAAAAFVMIVFHLNILLAFPMGVPLEWNVFMIFGVLWLFVAHAHLGLSDVANPLPIAVLFVLIAGTVVIGNLHPRKVSFLPGMRYYAGNWDTTVWCVKPAVDEKIRLGSRALGPMYHIQLERLYKSKEETLVPIHLAFAFRGMNTHGRALYTLVHRALAGYNEDDYNLCEGENLCAMVLGWNFGDGHMHNECLIEALQERCGFEPGGRPSGDSRRATHPQADPGVPARRRGDRRVRARLRERRRYGRRSAVGRRPAHTRPPQYGRRRQRFLTRCTTTTTTRAPTPASDAVTTGFSDELDHPGPEIIGEAAGIGALSK